MTHSTLAREVVDEVCETVTAQYVVEELCQSVDRKLSPRKSPTFKQPV